MHFGYVVLFFTLLASLISFPLLAKDTLPTPPGGGEGLRHFPPDNDLPVLQDVPANWLDEHQDALQQAGSRDGGRIAGDIGGDDVTLAEDIELEDVDMVTDHLGQIHVVATYIKGNGDRGLALYRSTDGGTTFIMNDFSAFNGLGVEDFNPCIVACEGNENRIYLFHTRRVPGSDDTIIMNYFNPGDEELVWSPVITVMAASGVDFDNVHVAEDSDSYSNFYLYVVAEGDDGNGQDIWYTRSIDYGASFESAYQIATLDFSDRAYRDPAICYGYGGYVHVAWSFEYADESVDAGIRYRRCDGFGGGGLASWDFWRILTPDGDEAHERRPTIAASQSSPEVMVAAEHKFWYEDESFWGWRVDTWTRMSADSGAAWGPESLIDQWTLNERPQLIFQPVSSEFLICGWGGLDLVVLRAHKDNPTVWVGPELLDDSMWVAAHDISPGIDIDFTRNQRLAVAFIYHLFSPWEDALLFDAEWRRDPGYPNFEDGWPVALAEHSIGSPCLADLDGNGDLEIIFPTIGNKIEVFDHEGTPHPGWPQQIGRPLAFAPVAVGDLNGDGRPSLVFGTMDGAVFVYDAEGNPDPYFPVQMPQSENVSVSLGAVGGPYPRMIVAVAGESIRLINYRGLVSPDGWDFPGQDFNFPAAIGDVDGDQSPEVVAGGTDLVVALSDQGTSDLIIDPTGNDITGGISLGDLDLDGDVEIVIPVIGSVEVWNDYGSPFPGFPVYTTEYRGVSEVALAQILGGAEPELVCALDSGHIDGYVHDGSPMPQYPMTLNPGIYVPAAPILGDVNGFPSEVVMGSPLGYLAAWNSYGELVDGWPKAFEDSNFLAAAMGDIDLDGNSEIVFTMTDQLVVLDIGSPPLGGTHQWPMQGHDAARTSCLDCPEDVLSAVNDPAPGITRLHFAQPAPNPTSGPTTFSFDLPVRATVRLEVYDLRGQRVRTIVKEELPEGRHEIQWDSRDAARRPLASGIYFARLKAQGPGLGQERTRKINLLR